MTSSFPAAKRVALSDSPQSIQAQSVSRVGLSVPVFPSEYRATKLFGIGEKKKTYCPSGGQGYRPSGRQKSIVTPFYCFTGPH